MRAHDKNQDAKGRTTAAVIRTVFGTILLVSALLAIGERAARAQALDLEPPRRRQGYYLSFGLYGAATQAIEKGDSLGPWIGYGQALRAGQLITRRLSLGIALEGAATSGGGQKGASTALVLEAGFAIAGNLALRGGVGVGFMTLKNPNDPTESALRGAGGSYFALGASYDQFIGQKRLTGGLALTPVVEARYIPGSDTTGIIVFIGVDLSYWTGLPLNQLDLPPSEAWRARKPGE
jgi:hypothetical protein